MKTHIQSFHTMNLYGIFLMYKQNQTAKRRNSCPQSPIHTLTHPKKSFGTQGDQITDQEKISLEELGLGGGTFSPYKSRVSPFAYTYANVFSYFYYEQKCRWLIFKVLWFPIAQRNTCGWSTYHQQNFKVGEVVSNLSFKK